MCFQNYPYQTFHTTILLYFAGDVIQTFLGIDQAGSIINP